MTIPSPPIDWNAVVADHGGVVWQTAWRLLGHESDAADCFQNTFLAAVQAARRTPVEHWPAFLKKLATARTIDLLRRSVTALATAAAIAAAAVGMVDVWPTITGTRSATAQDVETIRRAVAVRFTKQMAGSRVRVLEDGGVVREEHPDGTVMIMDYTQRRLLQLDPATKEAIQGTISGSDLPEGQSVLALFRDRITAADGAFVGRVSLGDMEAHE